MGKLSAIWAALKGGKSPSVPTSNSIVRNSIVRARYDNQFTTDENQMHWKMADAMSVDAGASWQVRRKLRMNSRYEYHNNGFYQNLVGNLANYTIGSGARLQMTTGDAAVDHTIEALFTEWSKEINLPQTMLNDRAASVYNGEAFQLIRSNPGLEHPVKMDVFEIECDQVSSPLFGMYPSRYPDQFFDGVVLDPWGRPQTYHVLRQHPGAFGAFVILGYEFDPWPARYVLHSYKRIRPGQQRGIPETISILENFAQLRRYRKAVLGAAETAANHEISIESMAAADDTTPVGTPWETVEFESGMGTVLPWGYRATQLKPEQPTTNFDMFCDSLLSEIAASLQVPLFFLTLDARKANMSSSYVVTQPMAKAINTDRELRYTPKMERIFREFAAEMKLVPTEEIQAYLNSRGYDIKVPANFRETSLSHAWHWPHINTHADPQKTANAAETRIASGVSSPHHECAAEGRNYEEIEAANAASYGISVEEYRAARRARDFAVATAGTTDGKPKGDDEADDAPEPAKVSEGSDDE